MRTNAFSSPNPFKLPPPLLSLVDGFKSMHDEKIRYKQLLFLASTCPQMGEELKVERNKVMGCLSTVHIHATHSNDGSIKFVGDSDGQLTKGLCALLTRGLSGATVEEIEAVDPGFIMDCGIGGSLTPSRNNGFINMLNMMKGKAKEVGEGGAGVVGGVR